jgi:hypothetical protein
MARRRAYRLTFNQPTWIASVFGELASYANWHTVSGGGLPWPVLVRLGLAEGRLVVTGLFIGAVDEQGQAASAVEQEREITSRALRAVSVPDITETIARQAARSDGLGFIERGMVETAHPHRRPRLRPGPQGYPRDHFRDVARRYRAALRRSPRAPIATLAREWPADPSTVRRWIGRARDMGYLGRAPVGRAGEQDEQEEEADHE